MRANKIFIDLYSTPPSDNITYEEYRKYYKAHNLVYILLLDKKIYTKVGRDEMFEKNMHHGCMLKSIACPTPQDVECVARQLINTYRLQEVTPDNFIALELEDESNRVSRAFELAEQMIRNT